METPTQEELDQMVIEHYRHLFDPTLSQIGLCVAPVRIPGDGNCLFHCLRQLVGLPEADHVRFRLELAFVLVNAQDLTCAEALTNMRHQTILDCNDAYYTQELLNDLQVNQNAGVHALAILATMRKWHVQVRKRLWYFV
jgi:hypothetical protein